MLAGMLYLDYSVCTRSNLESRGGCIEYNDNRPLCQLSQLRVLRLRWNPGTCISACIVNTGHEVWSELRIFVFPVLHQLIIA